MLSSLDATGGFISPPYSPTYQAKKNKKNPDLKDTGEFQRQMIVDVRQKELVFSSADTKTEMLVSKYGENIFGLSKKSLEEETPKIAEVFLNNCEKLMQ